MAALAYLLPPISGALAFFLGTEARVRFHGLQSVAIGVAWPVLLYGASIVSATATQLTFILGLVVWLGSLIITALGRDARVPVIGPALARSAGFSETR